MKSHAHEQPARRQKMTALTGRLRRHARKVTGPRQTILKVLRQQSHPLTIKEILVAVRDQRCDLATIYRAMHLLEEMHMVKRFDFGDGAARYELVREGDDGHHHHLICTRCAGVVEIDECFPEEIERRIARANGFTGVTHRLEVFGVCPACQK